MHFKGGCDADADGNNICDTLVVVKREKRRTKCTKTGDRQAGIQTRFNAFVSMFFDQLLIKRFNIIV